MYSVSKLLPYSALWMFLLFSCKSAVNDAAIGGDAEEATKDSDSQESGGSATNDENNLDREAPLPGRNGVLELQPKGDFGFVITWAEAEDAISKKSNLSYRVCLDTNKAVIDSAEEVLNVCEPKGWVSPWGAQQFLSLSNLKAGTEYVINVIVKDEAGNYATYKSATFSIGNTPSQPAFIGEVALVLREKNGVKVSWTKPPSPSTENIELDYRLCWGTTPTVGDYAEDHPDCKWYTRWSRDLDNLSIKGLMGHGSYYLSVFVRDANGEVSKYKTFTVPQTAPDAVTRYVDSSPTITNDINSPGLDAGDTVTFSAGSPIAKESLIYGTDLFSTLSAAHSALIGGDGVIYLAPGEFPISSQLVITGDVAIVGAGSSESKIQIQFNTGSSGDTRGGILASAGSNLTVAMVEISGSSQTVHTGIRSHSDNLNVHNCVFKDLIFSTYEGRGIHKVAGNSLIEATHFTNIGRIGMLVEGVGNHEYRWNHYVGKGVGNFVDYAFESDGSLNNLVWENKFENIQGVASTDSSTSAAVYIHQVWFSETGLTANRNMFKNAYAAFYIGISADNTVAALSNNYFGAAVDWGIISFSGNEIIAKNNWWNDLSGPEIAANPGGVGAKAWDVTFDPWLTTEIKLD